MPTVSLAATRFSGAIATSQNITVTATPSAGDVFVLVYSVRQTTTVTGVSGLGATWTIAYQPTSSTARSMAFVIGTGATSSGTVTVTTSTSRSGIVDIYLVSGLSSTTTVGVVTDSTFASALASTAQTADAGQVVFSAMATGTNNAGIVYPSTSSTPSQADWTAQAIAGSSFFVGSTAYAIPSSSASYASAVSLPSGSSVNIAQVVIGSTSTSTSGTVSATLPALTASVAGNITLAAAVAATLPPLSAAVAATVAGITTGTVAATLPPLSASVQGTVLAPVTGTVQVTLPALTANVTDAAGTSAELRGGGTIAVTAIDKPTVVTLTDVTLTGGGIIAVGELLPVVPQPDIILTGGGTITARPQDTLATDPRTGADQWRYVITDLQDVPLGELVDIAHDPVEDGVGEPTRMSLTLAMTDPARALISPIEGQCQVWHGNRLLLRGPILNGTPSDDGATITHEIHDPSWWWRGGRRRIGRIPKQNLLYNGDFTQGLAGWTGGFDADSIPAAAPQVTVVDDDFTDGGKAAEITGVESVTQTKTSLDSAAVFYPNRPFSWEPLAAGFKPGGAAQVDSVASAMPSTAGLKVSIVGHTANDGTGSGMALSLRRAQAAAARVAALRPGAVITTKGVGFYDPDPNYPIDSAQQRRVVISYESTVTVSAKSKQWIRQTVVVTQPKAARYALDLTGAAWLKVTDSWTVQDANMVAIKVVARRQDTPTVEWDTGSTSISDTDPVDRWLKEQATVTIPADGRPYLVDVYLYAPAALARYTRVALVPTEILYFWGVDQALIVKGTVEHMQDPVMGKQWPITVGTRTPLTGVLRDRSYPHYERMPIETALDEWPSLYRGMDVDTLFPLDGTFVATFHPRQGQVLDYVLALGGNVAKAAPATTRDVGSSIIAQSQDSGPAREEAYAVDDTAFGGLRLERLITAEQETPVNELDETALAELSWARISTAGYWLDIDPEFIPEVLAQTSKGDTVRLILDWPDEVDTLVRIVKRQHHPTGLRLMVSIEES